MVSASDRERERETFVQKERADCEAIKALWRFVINTLTRFEIELTDFGFYISDGFGPNINE